MFGTLGGPEVILILVVALIVFGPRRLPEIGKSMGKMLAEFRKASNDFKRTIEDELEAEKVRESQPPATPPAASPPPDVTPAAPPVHDVAAGPEVAPTAESTHEPRLAPPEAPTVSRAPSPDEK